MTVPPQQAAMPVIARPALVTPYIDSSVFIAHIKRETTLAANGSPRFEITKHIFEGAEQKKYQIYTSFFTLAEVRRMQHGTKPISGPELVDINAMFNKYLQNEFLLPIELSREVGEKAQSLGAAYGIKPGDAVHLASAVVAKCNVLLVWDKESWTRHMPANGMIDGVFVSEPYWEGIVAMPIVAAT